MKIKIILITFSISVLTFIPLMKSNFGAPVTMKKWAPLSWDDFQGVARPFSAYAAAITSYIYLDYDSINEKYMAYSAQNNQKSCVKSKLYYPEYVLNHEQYHFNISEVHARMLNKQLDSIGDQDPFELLGSHRFDLSRMQSRFDDDTDHGSRRDIERLWEYRIDSMLQHHQHDSTFTTEYYSGARAFFPVRPKAEDFIAADGAIKGFSMFKYDMFISVSATLLKERNNLDFNVLTEQTYIIDSVVIQSFEKQNSKYGDKVRVSTIDTIKNTKEIKHLFIKKPYLYQLQIEYPILDRDSTGYEQIADSFFNSFSIVNTDNHFLQKVSDNYQVNIQSLGPEIDLEEMTSGDCMTYMPSLPNGYYRGPIYNDNGDMLFAHDVIEHEDSLLLKNVMVIGNSMFDSETRNGDQILFIPKHTIPEGNQWVSIGYFLLGDTSKVCYSYYNQMIYIEYQAF